MKYLKLLFLPLLSLVLFSSCGDDEDITMEPTPTKNIVELAQENGFTSLASALIRTDLLDDIENANDITVFAPTNEAFAALLEAVGQTSIDDVPVSVLEDILLYHVVPAKVLSSQIADGEVQSLQGSGLTLSTNGGITVNGVNVITPFDVEASNGVIHTVEQVLVPASVAQFVNTILEPAYFNTAFSSLVQAVVKADLVETILNAGPITIFAPTDQAFADAGIDPAAVDASTLTAVLTYHVVGAKVMSTQLTREAQSLNGEMLYFSLTPNGAFINGNIGISAVDVESGDGVVHVIDRVLLPPTGNIVETAIELSSSGEFTSLIAALTRTATEGTPDQNLINVLSGNGPFTVFAPTNAAFEAVLNSNPAWNSLNDIPLDVLISVLTYHVVPARAYDKDLPSAVDANSELPTAFGKNISIDLNNVMINDNSKIIDVNYNCSNGVIHVIDNVLLPS